MLTHLEISNASSINKTRKIGGPVKPGYSVMSFTTTGVIFKAQHLAKQSKPTKPLADFYPKFTQDTDICPVTT